MRRSSLNPFAYDFWFGNTDVRPLALFRIVLSALILKDAVYHLSLSHWFYSDAGIVPRSALFDGLARAERFSLMDTIGLSWMATGFFMIWILVLVLMMLGYNTRLMTILNFIIMLSVHERNVYILTGADTLMRVLSFWLIFTPAGQVYSIDALRKRWARYRNSGSITDLRASLEEPTNFALPIRLLQIQFLLVYIVTGYLKAIGPVWQDGDALHYVLQLTGFLLPPGEILRDHGPEWLLTLLNYYVIVLELTIPILLFFPLWQPIPRIAAIIGGLALHLGLGLTLAVPDFPPLMMSCYLLFLYPEWIHWLDQRLRQRRLPVWVQYDPADSVLRGFLLLTSPKELRVVADENGTEATLSRPAVTQYAGLLPLSRFWLVPVQFLGLTSVLQGLIAVPAHSPQPVTDDETIVQPVRGASARLALSMLLITLMLIVIWWNIESTWEYKEHPLPPPPALISDFAWFTGIWQYWDLFAPLPYLIDGDFVIEGQFENGLRFNLYNAMPLGQKDAPIQFGPRVRWVKFEEVIFNNQQPQILDAWSEYYCRHYNDTRMAPRGTRLKQVRIGYEYVRSHAPGEAPNEARLDYFWVYQCDL